MVEARHIQNFSEASALEPHWGYADRAVPCTNDPGSCAYLDQVYGGHDAGMLYSGIFWLIIAALLLLFAIGRNLSYSNHTFKTLTTFTRRHLTPEFRSLRWLFGHTTRLQVVLLAAIAGYMLIFSFAGMKYATWVTPVKNSPGVYNTRTTLGPWSDRVGLLAYALTPLSILLASRESLLSVCTGIPYHHFNFLHRWIGHIIFAQSALHTVGWCIIEIKLYQPQPTVAISWVKQLYVVWGIVAMILLLVLWILSLPWARRRFGYEFFRKAHYVLAMVYIGACWAHWDKLICFLLPSLILWFIDRGIRFIRTGLIHYKLVGSGKGLFQSIPMTITRFENDVIRLDFVTPNATSWSIGQHFYLTFRGAIWQSHPFTPLNAPNKAGRQSYILRAKSGETKRLASMRGDTSAVILTGPYGQSAMDSIAPNSNVLLIAGGTGIAFILPVALALSRTGRGGRVELLWVVRNERHEEWIAKELEELRELGIVKITIHSTHSEGSGSTSPASEEDEEKARIPKDLSGMGRPDLGQRVREFVLGAPTGPTTVFVSGPGGMTSDVRDAVAGCNDPKAVWRGEEAGEVKLVYDERLE